MISKRFLAAAAVGAISLVGVGAQNNPVFSVNVVGYANVGVPAGFSLIANQLNSTDNRIAALLPTAANGTTIYKWTGTTFQSRTFSAVLNMWLPDGNLTLNPGEGAFISVNSPTTLTFVGEVPQGADSNITIPAGFSIVSSAVPQQATLTGLAFPAQNGDTVYRFVNGAYVSSTYSGVLSMWLPSEPTIKVGEAFWSSKSQSAAWNRNFAVN